VRPEKLYAVGRSAKWRTSRPVIIVVPEPATPSLASAVTPQSFRSRLWSIAKVVGPSAVAVAAIIISLLAYGDQHQADQEAANSNMRQQAQLVSFLQQQGSRQASEIIAINNYSEAPVSGAAFLVNVILNDGRSFSATIPIGSMPACSLGRITGSMIQSYFNGIIFTLWSSATSGTATLNSNEFPNNNNYRVTVVTMYFTDDNGVDWQYSAEDALETARLPLNNSAFSNNLTIATGNADSIIVGESSSESITPSYEQSRNCT
jgi:hypothetical protein